MVDGRFEERMRRARQPLKGCTCIDSIEADILLDALGTRTETIDLLVRQLRTSPEQEQELRNRIDRTLAIRDRIASLPSCQ